MRRAGSKKKNCFHCLHRYEVAPRSAAHACNESTGAALGRTMSLCCRFAGQKIKLQAAILLFQDLELMLRGAEEKNNNNDKTGELNSPAGPDGPV